MDTQFTNKATLTDAGWFNDVNRVAYGQPNLAALRESLTPGQSIVVPVFGWFSPGDGGGGSYWYNPADTTSTDDNATVVVTTSGARWHLIPGDFVRPETFGAQSSPTFDSAPAIARAIAYALANGISEVRSQKLLYIGSTVDFSNFTDTFRCNLRLAVMASWTTTYPPVAGNAGWLNQQPMVTLGSSGGSQVGLELNFPQLVSGGVAWGVLDYRNGSGGSRIHVGQSDCGITIVHEGGTSPTNSNYYTGDYWQSKYLHAYLKHGTSVNEGTTFDVNFMTSAMYGGILFYDGAQYLAVRGQSDFNGQWTSRMQVPALTNINVGDTVTSGAATALVLAAYASQYEGNGTLSNFIIVAETSNVMGAHSNFTAGSTITSTSGGSQVISAILTCNESGSGVYFDLISGLSSAAPFWRGLITAAYMGGIFGRLIWNATVDFGNSNNSFSTWVAGCMIYNSGTILSFADARMGSASFLDVSDTLFAPKRPVYLANNPIYGNNFTINVPNNTNTVVYTFPVTAGTGEGWDFFFQDPTAGCAARGTFQTSADGSAGYVSTSMTRNCTVLASGLSLEVNQQTGAAKSLYGVVTRSI